MKSLWFLIGVCLILIPSTTKAQEVDDDPVAVGIQSVVKIDVYSGTNTDSPIESGSGVIVSSTGIIFTNRHVVDEQEISRIVITLTSSNGIPLQDPYIARIIEISENPDFDFAVLQINSFADGIPVEPSTLDLPYVENWSEGELRISDEVYVAGYPGVSGGELFIGSGLITSLALNGTIMIAQANLPVSGGISGGLVFNTNGEMVGLVFEQSNAGQDDITPILSIQSICEEMPDLCEQLRPNTLIQNPVCLQPRVTPYCETTRLNIGMTAQIGSLESQVQLRAEPIWRSQWLKPLSRGSFVTVVGGPQASLDDVLAGFELFWWEVEDSEGAIGWVVETYFGEPVLIPAFPDEPVIPSSVCQLVTRVPANIRSGPGAEFEQIASRKFDEPLAADGQFRASDNFIWWRLIEGFWVREDAVREDDNCFTLPVVAP